MFVGSARIRSSTGRRAEAVLVRVLAKADTTSLLPPALLKRNESVFVPFGSLSAGVCQGKHNFTATASMS